MAHQLEFASDGQARMAYSNREIPWHRLGVPMEGLQTAEAMLAAAQADFDVVTTRVAVCDDQGQPIRNPDGEYVMIPDSRATVRVNPDGTFNGLATVGTRYVVQQNRECLDYALAIVGASSGDAVVDTCGVLNGGREFFSSIDLGPLIIDPMGVNDEIARYLLVRNGHDGKIAITFANTSIRAVCKNTVVLGVSAANRVFTARHTRNAERAMEQANDVLRISRTWATEFTATANKLLSISVPPSSKIMDDVLNQVFPLSIKQTDRQQKNRDNIIALVKAVYMNENNAKNYGFNAWSTVNAIGEYLDHYRDATVKERAIASMDSNSWVTRSKLRAQDYLLSRA
jgi:phage/plasmid-like protein (TIGR03299 family)